VEVIQKVGEVLSDLFFKLLFRVFIFFLLFLSVTGCSHYKAVVLWPSVRAAQKDFQAERYDVAITRYNLLSTDHPNEKKRQFFLTQKGLGLYLIHAYHDSEKTFLSYLSQYPDGLYKSEAEAYIIKIEALRSEKERNYIFEREEIKDDAKLLRQMIEMDPYNAQVHYDLANKLWDLEKYNSATKHYLKAGEINAALKEKDLLKNRLMINKEGKVVPVTPKRQMAMDRENNPLIIFDSHDFRQRRKPDFLGASLAFFTVSGKIRNQGKRVLRGVSVSVNFYNMRYEILDTRTFHIGTMGPREVRAFLVKGSNYDVLDNITSYECVPNFQ
jgi:tetratricopeptide (TPR) repeat protein